MSYTYIYRKILFADWCKLIFFFFLLWNCTNIVHIDREKRNDLFKHCTIVKAHFENPRVYPIFAFDVSHFKRGEFSLILITRITTIFSLSNILQFHTILIISSVYIYIYIYLGILNTLLQTILSRMNRSHRVDTYAKIVILFLPSFLTVRRKFKRGILKKSISSTRWNVRGYSFFISWHFIFLFVVIFTIDRIGSAN